MNKLWILILLVGLMTFGCVHILTPSQGTHTGYITEAGYEGLVWRTHYIKLVDAHFATYSQSSSSDQGWWYYGIDEGNLAIFNKASAFQKNNTLVTITYRCDFWTWYWERSEGCIATDVSAST